ncbi:predicted protein [Streptomyces viridochromogenes DSM 40736]|uniref:Predicted protein n=1 Tax=Streptomyces viridochromogenes (strain DSM 40736 / JCM 4977 / BCRC 1201 / Tue 494) TaxID=591159 RepID=D9XF68_STRVT|nr:predicted protein [Streptomyces viridochromogenes DSM 40736]
MPGGRAWLLTWDQAHDALAFYRHVGWWEPEPLSAEATDVVVFVDPDRARDGSGSGGAVSRQ